jgi:hypothetical protein
VRCSGEGVGVGDQREAADRDLNGDGEDILSGAGVEAVSGLAVSVGAKDTGGEKITFPVSVFVLFGLPNIGDPMTRLIIFALLALFLPASVRAQIHSGSTVYIEPMNGYETYLAAAIGKKQVPLILVADKNKAD